MKRKPLKIYITYPWPMIKLISDFFKGHERSVKAKKHIIGSFFVKGSSIVIGFLLVPITLNYLDSTRYGIWITLTSFFGWFSFFEIGLGNGLRNRLAEALALGNKELARVYVSTTYAILSIIIGITALVFLTINPLLNWAKILNTSPEMNRELTFLAMIIFGFFFIRFVLQLLTMILYATQRPAIGNIFGPISNFFTLILIFGLIQLQINSMLALGLIYSACPLIVLALASVYFFSKDYAFIRPSLRFIQFRYAKNLLSLGVKFFVIKISMLIMYQSSNLIIAHYWSPAEVTPYNIAFKYFSVISMLRVIIITPFWSAFTEAWTKHDISWIKNSTRKLLKIWSVIALLGIVMLIFSNQFYRVWVGSEVHIPFKLSFFMVIYFLLFSFGSPFNMFINGVGKIQLQIYSSIISAIGFFPLAFFFIKVLNFGVEGLVLTIIISNFYVPILCPIQFYKIINNKATGIWNR